MDAQQVLEAYIHTPGKDGDQFWEPLSQAITDLVHRAAARRETGDLEDFEEDCVFAIWSRINALKFGEADGSIETIEAFVRRAVHNRYCDAIRRKRPTWYNLKLEMLELFSGKANVEGFAIWTSPESGARLCGYTGWESKTAIGSVRLRDLLDNAAGFKSKFLRNRDPGELPKHELAAAVLDFCEAPVNIDELTSAMTELLQISSPEPLSIDSQPASDEDSDAPVNWLISPEADVESQVIDGEWFNHVLKWFWEEFIELSLKQRKALLYGMSGDQIMAMVVSVGMKEVSESLEIQREQLASLINRLPLPDVEIAEELQITPRAVPSVRFKAWGRIRRRVKKSSLIEDDL